MTAGKGIVHAEMPASTETSHGLQLWVNLPKKDKLVPPRYQEHPDSEVPRAASPDGGVQVKVIAGESMGVKAKVLTYIPICYLDFKMEKGKRVEQPIPSDWTAFVYTLSGTALIGSSKTKISAHTTVVLSKDGNTLVVETTEESDAHFVLIGGKPIGEPIVQHGPFVMNDQREIYQAIMDYQMGQNG
ncbi:hypothetical protein HK102_012166, partial [Quaeritorhiza haematococci]